MSNSARSVTLIAFQRNANSHRTDVPFTLPLTADASKPTAGVDGVEGELVIGEVEMEEDPPFPTSPSGDDLFATEEEDKIWVDDQTWQWDGKEWILVKSSFAPLSIKAR